MNRSIILAAAVTAAALTAATQPAHASGTTGVVDPGGRVFEVAYANINGRLTTSVHVTGTAAVGAYIVEYYTPGGQLAVRYTGAVGRAYDSLGTVPWPYPKGKGQVRMAAFGMSSYDALY